MAIVQNSQKFLASLFSNVESSPYCARCMLGASTQGIKKAINGKGPQDFWSDFTQDLGLWKLQVHFLFTVRTEEQTRQLLDRLNQCSCTLRDPRIREYHRSGRTMEEYLFDLTNFEAQSSSIAFIINLFTALLTVLEGAHVKSVAKRTTANHWPTRPEDLMPFGPKNLVDSFIIWSRIIPDFTIFRVAAHCIQFCGALLVPHATQPKLTGCAIDVGRQLFDRTWALMHMRSEGKRKVMGNAFARQVHGFTHYFGIFFNEQPVDKKATMIGGHEVKAIQVCSLLAYAVDDPRLLLVSRELLKTTLVELGIQFYNCMGLYFKPLPSVLVHPAIFALSHRWSEITVPEEFTDASDLHPEHGATLIGSSESRGALVSEYISDTPDDLDNLYAATSDMVINNIRNLRFDLYCSARDCPNSLQSTGRAFQRCGACNIAGYCSKRCQKAAWNSAEYPHKNICKIILNLVAIAGQDLIFYHPPAQSHSVPQGNVLSLHQPPSQMLTVTSLSRNKRIRNPPPPANVVYSPEKLAALVTEKWKQGYVNIQDLFMIAGWASQRMYAGPLPTKTECEPGFADYEATLGELAQRDKALKAQYLQPEGTTDMSQGYLSVRSIFDALSTGTASVHITTSEDESIGLLEG